MGRQRPWILLYPRWRLLCIVPSRLPWLECRTCIGTRWPLWKCRDLKRSVEVSVLKSFWWTLERAKKNCLNGRTNNSTIYIYDHDGGYDEWMNQQHSWHMLYLLPLCWPYSNWMVTYYDRSIGVRLGLAEPFFISFKLTTVGITVLCWKIAVDHSLMISMTLPYGWLLLRVGYLVRSAILPNSLQL